MSSPTSHEVLTARISALEEANKRLEEKLAGYQRNEERFQSLLKSTSEAYFEINLKGELVFFNDAVCRGLGYAQNVMFGRTCRELTLHEDLAGDLWPAEVDPRQIDQVLLNLYINAYHAMPEGGSLYIQTGNETLPPERTRPHDLEPGQYVRISVTDNGIGMDKAVQRRIFEPFFTTKAGEQGTGLGLASAYSIIKHHGGFISVYSEKGRGSTFNIYLPAAS